MFRRGSYSFVLHLLFKRISKIFYFLVSLKLRIIDQQPFQLTGRQGQNRSLFLLDMQQFVNNTKYVTIKSFPFNFLLSLISSDYITFQHCINLCWNPRTSISLEMYSTFFFSNIFLVRYDFDSR